MKEVHHSRNINKVEEFSDLQDDVRDFLKEVTRCKYSFAVASSRVWGRRVKQFGKNEDDVLEYEDIKREDVQKGKFYQLMPDGLDGINRKSWGENDLGISFRPLKGTKVE